jgi:hypothetical protein
MHRIGTLSGIGKLKSGTTEFGVVYYRMDVWKEGRSRHVEGTLDGNDPAVFLAFDFDGTVLELEGGEQVPILIMEEGSEGAYFRVAEFTPGLERLILTK